MSGPADSNYDSCYNPKEKILCFIERDYSKGMKVQYSSEFPSILSDRISKPEFESAIIRINNIFDIAETLTASTVISNILAFFFCYLNLILTYNQYEKQMIVLDNLIKELNREIFYPKNLRIYHPILRGLRLIMITDLSRSE